MSDNVERLNSALRDRYRLERKLGAGGMATVYLAEDVRHRRKVAVKVLRPDLAAVIGAERFLKEIEVTANLQHPHILPLFDSGEADSFLYYVMPFIDGESLRDKLDREKQLGVEESVEITKAVAGALDYAHRHNVIHRDIKPENILLHDEQPVVADFGIALAISTAGGSRITETGLSLGTPHYMSPEQATADRELTGRSDIYALGCMAYEMLVGEPPHTGATAQAVIAKIITEEPRRITAARNTVPPHVDKAIHRALAKLPADRFGSASDFAAALTATAPTTHASPTATSETKPARSWLSGTRAAVGAGIVIAMIAGIWWTNVRSDATAPLPTSGDPVPSIAVLPFEDPGAADDEQYFGDGVAETLIYALGKVSGLRVAAQTSAFTFRGAAVDLGSIGEQLNVGTVLRGNVQRAGNRLRVTVRLESTDDGAQLWSGQYDEQATDVFEIQDAIARAVVDELQVTLLGAAEEPLVQAGTANLEAYNMYLQGRYALARRADGLERGLELFEQAVELDAFYAQAHAGIADAYSLLGFWGYQDPTEAVPLARAAAERALSLDPSLAAPHATLGFIETMFGWDATAAEEHFQRALTLDSTYAQAHSWYGSAMGVLRGDFDEAVSSNETAVALDPLAPLPNANLGSWYSRVGRYDEGIASARTAVQLQPSWTSYDMLTIGLVDAGRFREALAAADSAVALSGRHPVTLFYLGRVYVALGDTAAVRALRDELLLQSGSRYVHPSNLAAFSIWLGEADVDGWLERAVTRRDPFLIWFVARNHWGWAGSEPVAQLGSLWSRMVKE